MKGVLDDKKDNEIKAVAHLAKVRRENRLAEIDQAMSRKAVEFSKMLTPPMQYLINQGNASELMTAVENFRRKMMDGSKLITHEKLKAHYSSLRELMDQCKSIIVAIPDSKEYGAVEKSNLHKRYLAFVDSYYDCLDPTPDNTKAGRRL